MKLPRFCLFIFSLFLSIQLCSQSKLSIRKETESDIYPSDKSLFKFLAQNDFSYALISWSTGGLSYNSFSCLLKRHEKWFLAEITRTWSTERSIIVKEKNISPAEADSLLELLKPDSAFQYSQWEFNNLPDRCQYKKDKKNIDFSVICSSTVHLLEFSPARKNYLHFYSPQDYFGYCYPFLPGFGILRGFVNTTHFIHRLTGELKSN